MQKMMMVCVGRATSAMSKLISIVWCSPCHCGYRALLDAKRKPLPPSENLGFRRRASIGYDRVANRLLHCTNY
jgi:hypothetical protein